MSSNVSNRSVAGLLVSTLFCLGWPAFQFILMLIIETAGYTLKLGGGLLNMLACALSLAAGVPLSIILLGALRREHAPLDPGRIAFLASISIVGASALVTGWCLATDMFCRVGMCPRPD